MSPDVVAVDPWHAVVGQPAAVASVRAALREDALAHAWLLLGPAGVGQSELARALAAACNCERPVGPDQPCGTCSTCTRTARGTHPALVEFEPEGTFHVVAAVRDDWIPAAMRTQTEGRRKVLRITAADRMNEAAQNAFLKVLEEPPASVVWLLEATDESLLLDTIVSRCRRLDVVPWTPEALATLAAALDIPADTRPALVRAALGSPERLRELADREVAEMRWRTLGLVGRLTTEGPGRVVPIAKEIVDWAKGRAKELEAERKAGWETLHESYGVEHDRQLPAGVKARYEQRTKRLVRMEVRRAIDTVLDDLASYLRDGLAVAAGAGVEGIVNVDHLSSLQRDAEVLGPIDAIRALEAVERCREALDRNGQPELQLERLVMALALPLYSATLTR
ncbi:MAG: ATP-binding protein [Actinomycetes bacterium]